MHTARSLLPALLAALAAIGGCPSTPSAPSGMPPSAPAPDADAGNMGAGTVAVADRGGQAGAGAADPFDQSTFEDQLRDNFPACGRPRDVAALQAQILDLVNAERLRAGLHPVRVNPRLEAQAAQYACQMIQLDFFGHINPVSGDTLRDRAAEFGYQFVVIGENLAAGQNSPQRVMIDWMSSASHRANILDERFTELGVGIGTGGRFRAYWVQEFGLPVSDN